MHIDELHRAVTQAIRQRAGCAPRRANQLTRGADWFSYYGIYTPELRELLREFKSQFATLTLDRRLSLARKLYADAIEEHASAATQLLAISAPQLTPAHFSTLDALLDHFHSWGTTDDFCVNVMYPLVEKYPRESVTLCRRWNRSSNPWKRRASVVAFTRKIGASGKFTGEVLRLSENLIEDDQDLVQKGVGWALKDNLRGSKKEVLAYVKNLRRRGVSAVITLYALRDLKGREREAILRVRKR